MFGIMENKHSAGPRLFELIYACAPTTPLIIIRSD